MPKCFGPDSLEDPLWNELRSEGIFDELAFGEGGIDPFQQIAIFGRPIEEMAGDADDDLARKEKRLLQARLDEAALVRAEIDDCPKGMFLHSRERIASFLIFQLRA